MLEFTPPFTAREAASLVIGQGGFTTLTNNNNQSVLNSPGYIAFDHAGNLWVSDSNDNRVLEFKAPFSSGESASLVLGQPDFNSMAGNPTQYTLNTPQGLAFDTHGNLWVSDEGNNRVVEFVPPFSTGMNATVVLGQSSYFNSGPGSDQSSLYYPLGLAAGPNGNPWVDDSGNYRVLLFTDPAATASTTTTTTQQSSATTSAVPPSQTTTSGAGTQSSSSTASGGIPEFPFQLAAVTAFTLLTLGAYALTRRRGGTRTWHAAGPLRLRFGP